MHTDEHGTIQNPLNPERNMESQLILNHADIGQLDRGAVGVAIDKALQEIGRDCLDRPTDERSRKLVLTLLFKPCPETFDQTVSCESIDLDVEIKAADETEPQMDTDTHREISKIIRVHRCSSVVVFPEP
jgi:hypothetical protein